MTNKTSYIYKSYFVDSPNCTSCNKPSRGATKAYGDQGGPSDGDYAICFYCGEIHQYIKKDDNNSFIFKKINIESIEDKKIKKILLSMKDALKNKFFA